MAENKTFCPPFMTESVVLFYMAGADVSRMHFLSITVVSFMPQTKVKMLASYQCPAMFLDADG